jgi:hypothetical protein
MPSVSVTTITEGLRKLSATARFIFGGLVVAAIGIFFPWQSVSGGNLGYSLTSSGALAGGGRFAILVLVALAMWLSWPTHAGLPMSVKRTIGLSVVVGLMILLDIVAYAGVAHNNHANAGSGFKFSPGFGLLVYTAAVIAVAIGVVRVWMHRTGLQGLRSRRAVINPG